MARNAHGGFSKKERSFKNGKNVPKMKVFWTWLKIGAEGFCYFLGETSAQQCPSARENRSFKENFCSLDFFEIEVGSFSNCDDAMT